VAVVGEGEEVEARGGAGIDVDVEPVENAGAALGGAGAGVEDVGVPVVVGVVVGDEVADVEQGAVRIGGEEVAGVLGGDSEVGGGVVEPVSEADHGVRLGDIASCDVDEGVGAGGEGKAVVSGAEAVRGVADGDHIDGDRPHAVAVASFARELKAEGDEGGQNKGGDESRRHPGSRQAFLSAAAGHGLDFAPP
jgi:hypothetical protein